MVRQGQSNGGWAAVRAGLAEAARSNQRPATLHFQLLGPAGPPSTLAWDAVAIAAAGDSEAFVEALSRAVPREDVGQLSPPRPMRTGLQHAPPLGGRLGQ